jgi:hypothetical protein
MGLFGKKSSNECEECGADTGASHWMYCDDCEIRLDINKGESGDMYQAGVMTENQRVARLIEDYLIHLEKSDPSSPEIAGVSKVMEILVADKKEKSL